MINKHLTRNPRSIMIKSIILPIADKAMKTSIASSIRQIKKMRQFSTEEVAAWQNKQLQLLVKHAYNNTKYYRDLFDNKKLKPIDIKSIEDLAKLPVLTKHDIVKKFDELIPDNIDEIAHKKSSTGGSSGDPMPYLLDNKSWSFSNANSIINWERTGYKYGDKFIALGSTSLFVDKKPSFKHKLYYKIKNKIGLNGINMSEEVCGNYYQFIKKNKIKFVYGYASSIYLLAKWVHENNKYINIKACFTTSEVLTSEFRKLISKAFNCPIVDCYGAHDGGITAFSHQEGFFEVNYNSIVRSEKYDSSSYGPILITDLLNYALPLINYKLGDEVFVDKDLNDQYSYNGQIINKVMGRTSDIILLENGNTLTGPGFTILFKDIPVEYYCIEKNAPNSLICWIIRLSEYNQKHEKIIFQTLKKQAGPDIDIEIKYTNTPFISESGKRKYMVNNSLK